MEVHKLAYLLESNIERLGLDNPLALRFSANRFGPYADRLRHLLDGLDGSYLHCDRRLADAKLLDVIWFEDAKKDKVAVYLTSPEANAYRRALEATTRLIDGFESPLGMELLATVDWLIHREGVSPRLEDVKAAIRTWPGGAGSAKRKQKLFDDRLIGLALERLAQAA